MTYRVPPHNLEAEVSIIGGLMVDSESFDVVSDTLSPEDFYKASHQKIYQAATDLHKRGQPVDIITISNYLSTKKELDAIGGPSALAEILNQVPAAINLRGYADIVKEKSLLRRLITTNLEIVNSAYDGQYDSLETFVDEVETKIFKVTEQKETNSNITGAADLVKMSIDKLTELSTRNQDITGIASGFSSLDKMTAGFQPGDLVIIAARPSMGKTAFSLNLAMHAALRMKKSVAYFSVEMAKEQLMMRLLASEARVNMSDVRIGRIKDSDWPRLIDKASKMAETNLFIDDTSSISPFEIRSKARRIKAQHGLDLILIDYLQIMGLNTRVERRERMIAEISKSLKGIAKELRVPVIALSQLNRGVEGRSGEMRKPVLSDLRESGAIEQDADLIMMLYREEYYEPDNAEARGQADLLVRKHRNGPVGEIKLRWQSQYGYFSELDASPETVVVPQGASLGTIDDFNKGGRHSNAPIRNFANNKNDLPELE
ncbi:MAG: replicative DNA helicase [Bdellovibrionaceae bacterium]|nr:replicative DNA helicase [Pseudobdellovibrionaceae bacterium]